MLRLYYAYQRRRLNSKVKSQPDLLPLRKYGTCRDRLVDLVLLCFGSRTQFDKFHTLVRALKAFYEWQRGSRKALEKE